MSFGYMRLLFAFASIFISCESWAILCQGPLTFKVGGETYSSCHFSTQKEAKAANCHFLVTVYGCDNHVLKIKENFGTQSMYPPACGKNIEELTNKNFGFSSKEEDESCAKSYSRAEGEPR